MSKALHVFIGGVDNDDYDDIHTLAKSGKSSRWSSTKNAKVGDKVLLYVVRPHSALIAKATVVKSAWKGDVDDWKYLARIGKIRLLPNRLTIRQLKKLFPSWEWLKHPRSKATVPPEIASNLWKLVHIKANAQDETASIKAAGFGDPQTNKLVEKAAIRKATRYFQKRGYSVVSRERDKIGYDLDVSKGTSLLHVEVKGVTGSLLGFPITRQEVQCAKRDPSFRICVVTNALTSKSEIRLLTGTKFIKQFKLRPISFMATKNR